MYPNKDLFDFFSLSPNKPPFIFYQNPWFDEYNPSYLVPVQNISFHPRAQPFFFIFMQFVVGFPVKSTRNVFGGSLFAVGFLPSPWYFAICRSIFQAQDFLFFFFFARLGREENCCCLTWLGGGLPGVFFFFLDFFDRQDARAQANPFFNSEKSYGVMERAEVLAI